VQAAKWAGLDELIQELVQELVQEGHSQLKEGQLRTELSETAPDSLSIDKIHECAPSADVPESKLRPRFFTGKTLWGGKKEVNTNAGA